jgi:hypothetical protein
VSARASELARAAVLAVAALAVAACAEPSGTVLRPRRDPPPTGRGAGLLAYGAGYPRTVAELDDIARAIAIAPTPFDGVVVDLGFQSSFSGAPAEAPEAEAMALRFRTAGLAQLARSYVLFEVRPGDVDWADDAAMEAVRENVRRAAAHARAGGLRGLFFDDQAYGAQLFSYPDVADGEPFDTVRARVRARARALMEAVLGELDDPTVVLTLGPGETWRSVCLDGVAIEADRYGLLPAFVDGLSDAVAAAGRGRVVDGLLSAYPTTEVRAVELLHAIARGADDAVLEAHWFPGVPTYRWPRDPSTEVGEIALPDTFATRCDASQTLAVRRVMPAGLGLMLDYGQEGFDADSAMFDANYRTPAELRAVLSAALERADEVVWLWTSHVDFFARPESALVPLPEAYRVAMLQARIVMGEGGSLADAGAP